MAVVLLVVNSRIGAWQSVAVVATMFAGTALYRLDQGQVRRGVAGWVIGLVPVVSVGAAAWFGPGWSMAHQQAVAFRWSWSTAVAAAWLTFLIGRRLRSSAWPALIVRLGLISYSVYLLHPLLIQVLRRSIPDPVPVPLGWRITWFWVLLAAVVASAVVSHRFIELPGQGVGRRLARSDRLRRLRSVVPGGRTRP